jgi:hypothetical protein
MAVSQQPWETTLMLAVAHEEDQEDDDKALRRLDDCIS